MEKLNLTFIRKTLSCATVTRHMCIHTGINSLIGDAASGLKLHDSLKGHPAILGPYPTEKEGAHRPQLLMRLLMYYPYLLHLPLLLTSHLGLPTPRCTQWFGREKSWAVKSQILTRP